MAIGVAYYQNDYSLSDIGLFRFARAGIAVSFFDDFLELFSLSGNMHGNRLQNCYEQELE
jgi:hypothetical protein